MALKVKNTTRLKTRRQKQTHFMVDIAIRAALLKSRKIYRRLVGACNKSDSAVSQQRHSKHEDNDKKRYIQ
jgi:hypothetical protein